MNVLKEQNDTEESDEDQPFPFKPSVESKKLQLSPQARGLSNRRQLADGQVIGG